MAVIVEVHAAQEGLRLEGRVDEVALDLPDLGLEPRRPHVARVGRPPRRPVVVVVAGALGVVLVGHGRLELACVH